jgi:hypothetical protein
MASVSRTLLVFFCLWTTVSASLSASYDVVWNKPGVNGSADSMPLGGGDVGLNTWYENGKLTFSLILLKSIESK